MTLLDQHQHKEERENPVDGKDTDESTYKKVDGRVGLHGVDVESHRGEEEATNGEKDVDAAGTERRDIKKMRLVWDSVMLNNEDGVNINDEKSCDRAQNLNRVVFFHGYHVFCIVASQKGANEKQVNYCKDSGLTHC